MTKDEIRDMQTGPEMDKIVAEKVTGTGIFSTPPRYSTEIAAAWDILPKFHWVNLLKGRNVGLHRKKLFRDAVPGIPGSLPASTRSHLQSRSTGGNRQVIQACNRFHPVRIC